MPAATQKVGRGRSLMRAGALDQAKSWRARSLGFPGRPARFTTRWVFLKGNLPLPAAKVGGCLRLAGLKDPPLRREADASLRSGTGIETSKALTQSTPVPFFLCGHGG